MNVTLQNNAPFKASVYTTISYIQNLTFHSWEKSLKG
jgi:hypothetical protein